MPSPLIAFFSSVDRPCSIRPWRVKVTLPVCATIEPALAHTRPLTLHSSRCGLSSSNGSAVASFCTEDCRKSWMEVMVTGVPSCGG
jgi:hypothetical protein